MRAVYCRNNLAMDVVKVLPLEIFKSELNMWLINTHA